MFAFLQLQSMVPSPAPESSSDSNSLHASHLQSDLYKISQKPTITSMEPTATERLQRLMTDCGYSTERLQNMYSELPPRKLRDALVDHYFSTMSVLVSVPFTPDAHISMPQKLDSLSNIGERIPCLLRVVLSQRAELG